MDGPILIRLTTVSDDELKLDCISRGISKEIAEHTLNLRLSDLRSELLKVAKDVINSCDELGWESDDTRFLKKEFASLS